MPLKDVTRQLDGCISGSGEPWWLETRNFRCLGGTEVEEGVRSLCGGQKASRAARGKGESLWSGFMDAEDKGMSRKRLLSASELLQKGLEAEETWKLGD